LNINSAQSVLDLIKSKDIEFNFQIKIGEFNFELTPVLEVGSQLLCFAKVDSKIRLFYKSRSNGSYRVAPYCTQGAFAKGIYVSQGGYTYETKLCLELQKFLSKLEPYRLVCDINELENIISEYSVINVQEYNNREIQNVFSVDCIYEYVPGFGFAQIKDVDSVIDVINVSSEINNFFDSLEPFDYYVSEDVNDGTIESFVFKTDIYGYSLVITINSFGFLSSDTSSLVFHIAGVEGESINDFGCSQRFFNTGFLSQKSIEYPFQLPKMPKLESFVTSDYTGYVSTMPILNKLNIYQELYKDLFLNRAETLELASGAQIHRFLTDQLYVKAVKFLELVFKTLSIELNETTLSVFLYSPGIEFVGLSDIKKMVFKNLLKQVKQNVYLCEDFVSLIQNNSTLYALYKKYCYDRCERPILNSSAFVLAEFISELFYYDFFAESCTASLFGIRDVISQLPDLLDIVKLEIGN